MSDNLIHLRDGQRISIDEYPEGFMADLNEKLNGLPEYQPTRLDRAADWFLDSITEGTGLRGMLLIAGIGIAVVIVSQVARIL